MEKFRNIQEEATNSLVNRLAKKFESLIIDGLKLKGFDFSTKEELEHFIKQHCRCEDNIQQKERVYYVYDIPFFLHKYESEYIPDYRSIGTTITANYGSYRFL